MIVEYELDQWEWQGTTRSIEVDPNDYAGMSVDQIKREVYAEIKRDAEQNLHLVYREDEVAQEILDGVDDDEEDEEMINFRNNNLVRDGFTRPTDGEGCPRDTNGDGDCGRPACPYCGQQPSTQDDDDDEDGPSLTEDGEPIYRSVNCSRCGKRTHYDPIYEDLCASCCRADNE